MARCARRPLPTSLGRMAPARLRLVGLVARRLPKREAVPVMARPRLSPAVLRLFSTPAPTRPTLIYRGRPPTRLLPSTASLLADAKSHRSNASSARGAAPAAVTTTHLRRRAQITPARRGLRSTPLIGRVPVCFARQVAARPLRTIRLGWIYRMSTLDRPSTMVPALARRRRLLLRRTSSGLTRRPCGHTKRRIPVRDRVACRGIPAVPRRGAGQA